MTAPGSLSSGRRRRDVSGSNVTTKAPTVKPTQPPSGGGGSTGHEESTTGAKMEGRVLVSTLLIKLVAYMTSHTNVPQYSKPPHKRNLKFLIRLSR